MRTTIAIRWRDLDMLGHLNQAVYHELLEDARGALIATTEGAHSAWVLARVELDYRVEVTRAHSPVECTATVLDIGTKSMTIEQELIRNDGVVAAAGHFVVVAWDLQTRTSRVISGPEREALRRASAT